MPDELTGIVVPLLAALLTGVITIVGSRGVVHLGGFSRLRALRVIRKLNARVNNALLPLTPRGVRWQQFALYQVALYAPMAYIVSLAAVTTDGLENLSSALTALLLTSAVAQFFITAFMRDGVRAASIARDQTESGWHGASLFYGLLGRFGPAWVGSVVIFVAAEAEPLSLYLHTQSLASSTFIVADLAFLSYVMIRGTFLGRMRIEDAAFRTHFPAGLAPRLVITLAREGSASPAESFVVLEGIGNEMLARRADGYRESIRWSDIARIAVSPE
jgi:hypothetical protein